MQLIKSKKLIPYKRPFADCEAILLMSRWRAINTKKKDTRASKLAGILLFRICNACRNAHYLFEN